VVIDPIPSKIVCVGRNYPAHAAELGHAVPERPLLFLKPPSSLIGNGEPIILPAESDRVDHEAEIGVVVGRRLRHATPRDAETGIGAFVCLNDVTARDLQRSDGQWTRAKGFDTFCPVSAPVRDVRDWRRLEVVCRVNGQERQRGRVEDMHFPIPDLIAYISGIMTLEPGDIVATGTPSGVAPLMGGDIVEVEVPGVGVLTNPVIAEGDR
jgi:2-keto-4-pentenoate hydratase/2-oxohepta-3-ene-1,7-dioic acid hydratase in catechol pathway